MDLLVSCPVDNRGWPSCCETLTQIQRLRNHLLLGYEKVWIILKGGRF